MRISDWSSDVCSSDLLHVDKLGTQSIDNLCQVRNVEESEATGMDNGVGDLVIGQAWIGGMHHRADARNREEQLDVMVRVPGQRRPSIYWQQDDVTQPALAAAPTLGERGTALTRPCTTTEVSRNEVRTGKTV